MTTILQSLKTSSVKRTNHLSPIMQRRNKLLSSINLQCEAARAHQDGRQYSVRLAHRVLDPETGERTETFKEKKVRPSWWQADDGRVYLEVRYGYRPLEIAKGKSSIDIGDLGNLIPTLEKLKQAIQGGELDGQLEDAYGKLSKQLQGKRTKAK